MIDGITFAYNQRTNKIQVVCTGEAEISHQLAKVLHIPTKVAHASFISTEPIDLDRKPWMIKANFVSISAINSSYTNVLHVFTDANVRETRGDTNQRQSRTVEHTFSSLKFTIHDYEDVPIEFTEGILYLQLTFIHENN